MSIREDVSKMKLVSPYVAALSVSKRNAALKKVAEAIEIKKDEIFAENEKDLAAAKENNVPDPVVKRLKFNEGKLQDVIKGIDQLQDSDDLTFLIAHGNDEHRSRTVSGHRIVFLCAGEIIIRRFVYIGDVDLLIVYDRACTDVCARERDRRGHGL